MLSRVSGGSGPPSSPGLRVRRAGKLALHERGRSSVPTTHHAGTLRAAASRYQLPVAAGTSKRHEVLGSKSGWGKSVLAPRTPARGSSGHARGHVRRRAKSKSRRATPDLGRSGWISPAREEVHLQARWLRPSEHASGFGESVVVLGDPHRCRNRRAARGPEAPGEQPDRRLDLACGKQANACRKLGLGGEAKRHQWRPRIPTLRASHGKGCAGPFDGRRLELGKRRHWRAVCGTGSWLRPHLPDPERSSRRAARQEASGNG